MASEIEIVNLALVRFGEGAPIASLDEASEPAQQARAALPFVRDFVLHAYNWPFAQRRVSLALVPAADPSPWAYAYRLPPDCLTANEIGPASTDPIPFELTGDADGQLVLIDHHPATLRYTARIEALALLPPLVASLVAWRLGAEIARALSRESPAADRCLAGYRMELPEAVAHAERQRHARPDPLPASILARR